MPHWRHARPFILLCCALGLLGGCQMWRPSTGNAPAPQPRTIVRGQLIIETDFPLDPEHRLLDELTELRQRVNADLALPTTETPIEVRVFASNRGYREHMEARFPAVAGRRAFFVQTRHELSVFAWWGDHVAEDLRHEVTHGYLHAVVPEIPLWLDEGLAEYYEVPPLRRGLHHAHINLLLAELRDGSWRPDMNRLEQIDNWNALTQRDYAEAWLWAHFLLRTTDARRETTQRFLQDLVAQLEEPPAPLSEQLAEQGGEDLETQLLAHLLLVGRLVNAR